MTFRMDSGAAGACAALAVLVVLALPVRASGQTTKISGRSYVAFDGLMKKYRFKAAFKLNAKTVSSHPQAVPKFSQSTALKSVRGIKRDDYFALHNVSGAVFVFQAGSRRCYINGIRHWMNFPVGTGKDGRHYMSSLDDQTFLSILVQGFGALRKLNIRGVVVDAGHGGGDAGAVGPRGTEKAAALDTARRLATILKSKGLRVVMTRTSDKFVTLGGRSAIANKYKGYLFVSLHYNAGRSTSHGVEVYCMPPVGGPSASRGWSSSSSDKRRSPGNTYDRESFLLTTLVHHQLCRRHSDAGDRGVKRARFAVLRHTSLPGILVEGGFMSHRADSKLIARSSYRQQIAGDIANGIVNFIAGMRAKS